MHLHRFTHTRDVMRRRLMVDVNALLLSPRLCRIKKNSETVNKILVERSRVRAETGGAASSEAKTVAGGNNKGPFSDSSLSDLVSSVKVKGLGPAKGRKGRAATTTTTVTAAATKRSK
jgi:hypothetical protein